jgi:serine/threonine protein kinase
MTVPSLDRAPRSPAELEALAAALVGEMIERWRRGERPLTEDFLARHPELWAQPHAAIDLIYEELCLRQEHGLEVRGEDVTRRFPQWRPQLEVLLDCRQLLGPCAAAPRFPAVGESLDDFLLLAELGRGAQGAVFLASQRSLGERPVVLKLTPAGAGEHLSLARLQHTHIVPLHSAQDHPARGLHALCMPYFGGATLDRVLEALRPLPPRQRAGRDLLDALERSRPAVPVATPARGPIRAVLAGVSYVEAVCWIGACLADALQYARERGLVHLDVKPSNVLLAADGQPMLLDFHLARGPIAAGARGPLRLGGTTAYMSPEQRAAVCAIERGRRMPQPDDGRSDVYSLGVVLYEALGGGRPVAGTRVEPLRRRNPQVSVGLADVIHKCLAETAAARYAHAADLAADLRRHLADLPLAGVRNRSLAERWRKWRRRRPYRVALAGMALAVLTAVSAAAVGVVSHFTQQTEQARTALHDGQRYMAVGQWDDAVRTLRRGLSVARGVPFQGELAGELESGLRRAEQSRAAAGRAAVARKLHELMERVRFLYGRDPFPPEAALRRLGARCRALWAERGRVVERLGLRPPVREDLLDLAVFWADLQVRLAPPDGKEEARREALAVLSEAEALFGPSPVLDAEGRLHGGESPLPGRGAAPSSAWECCALGRSLLRGGQLDRAAELFEGAVHLQPQEFWANFYRGHCAYRQGRYTDAALSYSVCIGLAPEAPGCFYNRALALAALGKTEEALRDYDRALRLDPTLASPALERLRRSPAR